MEKKNLKKTGISYFAASLLLLAITFVNVRIAMAGDVSFKSMFASSYSGEDGEGGEGGESGEGGEGSGESGEGSGESGEGGESGESGESGGGGGGESESGEGGTSEEKCHEGGIYNYYLTCSDSGVTKIKCVEKGKLEIFGMTLFNVFYFEGNEYPVKWERWTCERSTGNCCMVSRQEVKILQ